jgi:hypothetical protein
MKKIFISFVLSIVLIACTKVTPIGYSQPVNVYGYIAEVDKDGTVSKTDIAVTQVTSVDGIVVAAFTIQSVKNVDHYEVMLGPDGKTFSAALVIPANQVQTNVLYSTTVKAN